MFPRPSTSLPLLTPPLRRQIWLENTDFNDAATSTAFIQLKEQAILLGQYYALTHPSEPNYAASVGGDFWGMADDDLYNIPAKYVPRICC